MTSRALLFFVNLSGLVMRSLRLSGLAALLVAAGIASTPATAQRLDIAAAQKRFQELYAAGNYSAALAQAQSTEAAARRAGTNNITYVLALNDLARAHQELGHYAEAAGMFKRALDALERNVGPSDSRTGQVMANLATVYLLQGNSGEAERLYRRALDIATRSGGSDDTSVVKLINNLGDVYSSQARYADAEAQYQRALDMAEKTSGPKSLQVALVLNNLTKIYEDQGRFADVENFTKRALAIREQALGPNHPDVAASLNNLAHVYERTGRYAESDGLYKRAIEIWEKLGPTNPRLATSLLNLASVYADEGRLDEAEALYKRSLAIREAAFGPDHIQVATIQNNLAAIYESEERYKDVETFAKKALAVVEKSLGKDNPDTAKVVRKLGVAYDGQGRHAEAEAQFNRSLAIFTKTFGPSHRFVATVLNSQGHLFEHQGRFAEAEQAYKRALAINEKARGVNHPDVVKGLNDLALLNIARDKPDDAIAYSRKASAAVLAQAEGDVSAGRPSSSDGVIEQRSVVFVTHVAGLAAAARGGNGSPKALGQEAFEMAQWAIQSSAGAALQQLGPRFAAGNDALAALVRTNQDLTAFLRERNKALVTALSNADGKSNTAKVDEIRKAITDTEGKLAANSAQLQQQFPEFSKLATPKPLQIDDAQKLLGPDEAMVLLLTGDKNSYVFAVTANDFDWRTIPTGGADLAAEIEQFRKGLDVDKLQPFDLDLAYRLFGQLIGPVDGLIKTKRQLLVVSSGTLTALPVHLLVTEKPAKAALPIDSKASEQDAAPYRDAAWLIKRQSVTVLPSVASLRTLRSFVRREVNPKPMIGFGDPIFSQESASGNARDATRTRSARSARSYTDYWRGAGLDRSALASAPRLPDTADELKAVARNVGAADTDIHLRRDASVTTVKHAPLENYRIVYFATHGLVAGDVKGLAEPALLLTLPDKPTPDDTGLLTASEAAQLKLNADWVVLSACNTAAGETPGAQALSGLARAFFYAGARALLVSHWPVATEAATRLTTSTFDNLKAEPTLGRSEALRRAMLAYLADRSAPTNAHPAYWGPFSLVGEGAMQ